MNRDTPDAVPADDFPFLGPAISPRRREQGSSLGAADELSGPFVRASGRPAETPAPAMSEEPDEELLGGLPLPGANWPSDDFPWLTPDQALQVASEPADAEPDEEFAVGDADDRADAAEATSIDAFGWGEGDPEVLPGVADDPYASSGLPWGEEDATREQPAAEADFGWEGVPARDEAEVTPDAGARAPEPVAGFGWEGEPMIADDEETEAFPWDDEPAAAAPSFGVPQAGDGSWGSAAESGIPGSDDVADDIDGELPGVPDFVWGDAVDGVPEAEVAGEHDEAEDFTVPSAFGEAVPAPWDAGLPPLEEAESAERWDSGPAGYSMEDASRTDDPESAAFAGEGAALSAAALPIGEWEDAAPTLEVADEVPHAPELPVASPLEDVAARLERIARSLRSGNPADALDQGDPLQLLITGYALGYAEARKGSKR